MNTTIRFQKKDALSFLFLWGLCLIPQAGSIICLVFLIYKLFSKEEWLAKSLFFALSVRMLNPVLFSTGVMGTFGSWIILFIVFVMLIIKTKFKNDFMILFFLIFCFIIGLSSYFYSNFLIISFLKLTTFLLGFYSVYIIYQSKLYEQWESFFYTFWQVVVVASIPLFFKASIGYAVNGTGFQGICMHPQAFGTILAPLTAYFGYLMFTDSSIKQNKQTQIFILIASLFMLYKTQSRTAVFAIIISTIILVIYSALIKTRNKNARPSIGIPPIFLIFGLLVFCILNFSQVSNNVKRFALKNRTEDIIETEINGVKLIESRQDAIDRSMGNFYQSPVFGIGFGAPSDPDMFNATYLPGTDIPISSPNEKGVIFPALLEENGVVGTSLFGIWFLVFIFMIVKNKKLPYIMLFFTVFFINFGEFIFFSANGFGIYAWYLMLLAYHRSVTPIST